MNLKEAAVILEIVKVKEYLLILKDAQPLLFEVGTSMKPIAEALVDLIADLNIQSIKRYQEKGDLSRNEAILLTLDSKAALIDLVSKIK